MKNAKYRRYRLNRRKVRELKNAVPIALKAYDISILSRETLTLPVNPL